MRILSVVFLGLFLLSCSEDKMKQNPCDGFSEEICNPIARTEKPTEDVDGIAQNSIVISPLEISNLYEDIEVEIPIKIRVVNNAFNVVTTIENLPEGAIFDDQKMQIRWKPEVGFVRSGAWQEPVNFNILAFSEEKGVSTRLTQTIWVHRKAIKPTLANVNPGDVSEGQKRTFEVVVHDVSTSYLGTSIRPRLEVRRLDEFADGSQYISMVPETTFSRNPVQDESDPTKWTFKLNLNLINTDATDSKIEKVFGLQAVNTYGIPSEIYTSRFNILNAVKKPNISAASSELVVNAGEVYNYSFSVFEPSAVSSFGNGKVSVVCTNCVDFSESVQFSCSRNGETGYANCEIKLHGSTVSELELQFNAKVVNSMNSLDVQERVFNKKIKFENISVGPSN